MNTSATDQTIKHLALPLMQKLALGAGMFSLFFLDKAVELLAIPFYQMTLAVDPFLFNLALTLPIIFSAFLFPWIGQLSDNYQSRFGRRRPFIIIAAWLSCLFFGFIWMVPEDWSAHEQLVYFFISCLLFYSSAAFYSVPLISMTYERTSDTNDRIKVMEMNSYFIKMASLLTQWLYPLATLTLFSNIFIGVRVVGWTIAILIIGVIGSLPAIFITDKTSIGHCAEKSDTVFNNLRSALSVPMLRLVAILIFLQLGIGAYAAKMDYYVLVYYMHDGNIVQGALWKSLLSMGYATVAAIFIPIVSWLARSKGKLQALTFLFKMTLVGGVAKWFIFSPGAQWLVLLDTLMCAGIWTAMTIIIPALVAEASSQVNHSGTLPRGGMFAALQGWLVAFSVVFALLVGGLSLNLIEFDAAKGGEQLPVTLDFMRYILCFGTVLPSFIAILILNNYLTKFCDEGKVDIVV